MQNLLLKQLYDLLACINPYSGLLNCVSGYTTVKWKSLLGIVSGTN